MRAELRVTCPGSSSRSFASRETRDKGRLGNHGSTARAGGLKASKQDGVLRVGRAAFQVVQDASARRTIMVLGIDDYR